MVEKKYDIFNVGIMVADIPIKLPLDTLDFSVDVVSIDKINILPGGDATNSSIALTDLGKRVALVATVGDDYLGKMILQKVGNRGVTISHVIVKHQVSTQTSLVMINRMGDRCFLVSGSSNQTLCMEDINTSLLKQSRHLNLGSFFAHPELEKQGAVALFKMAKEQGLTTSADIINDGFNTGLRGITDILQYVDYFMPSYIEAQHLTGETEPERMADYLINKTGDKTIIIKLGEEGCFVKNKTQRFYVDPYIEQPVDTTGAGDNFVAGFISSLLEEQDLHYCAKFACATAALSIKRLGATCTKIDRDQVLTYMEATKQRSLQRL
jgi:2-dehydro-3-deoxygluconokinase